MTEIAPQRESRKGVEGSSPLLAAPVRLTLQALPAPLPLVQLNVCIPPPPHRKLAVGGMLTNY
ncbi:MAG TPA: hypothetical protein V6D12_06380 [Candidatus Obscuribacterales bacterium]